MASQPKNHGQPWTAAQEAELRRLAQQNTPTRVIGIKMGRTPDAIYKHASESNVPLKPTNQSPYNRRKG
jgi:hypothetical protein